MRKTNCPWLNCNLLNQLIYPTNKTSLTVTSALVYIEGGTFTAQAAEGALHVLADLVAPTVILKALVDVCGEDSETIQSLKN